MSRSPESGSEHDAELAELLEEVRRIEVQSHGLVTDGLAGGYNSVFRGSGIEFDEVREYVDGDDPRAIDWNVTARTGRPHIKKFMDERELTVVFALDLSATLRGGAGFWSGRQMAARVCACLGLSAVENHDKVGFVAFGRAVAAGGSAPRYVPARKGIGHVMRIAHDILALPSCPGGRASIAEGAAFVAREIRRRAIVFVVSDFLEDFDGVSDGRPAWRDAVGLCAQHHDVIAMRIGHPELDALPPRSVGLVRIADPVTGAVRVVDWSDSGVRTDYRARVAAWREATNRELRRAEVDVMDVPVPREADRDAVIRPIVSFFRMREARGARV